jgi:hypothetical protein
MTKEREEQLRRSGGALSAEEWGQGWHFCPDFDYDLCGPPWHDELGSCEWCGFDGSAPYPGDAK